MGSAPSGFSGAAGAETSPRHEEEASGTALPPWPVEGGNPRSISGLHIGNEPVWRAAAASEGRAPQSGLRAGGGAAFLQPCCSQPGLLSLGGRRTESSPRLIPLPPAPPGELPTSRLLARARISAGHLPPPPNQNPPARGWHSASPGWGPPRIPVLPGAAALGGGSPDLRAAGTKRRLLGEEGEAPRRHPASWSSADSAPGAGAEAVCSARGQGALWRGTKWDTLEPPETALEE